MENDLLTFILWGVALPLIAAFTCGLLAWAGWRPAVIEGEQTATSLWRATVMVLVGFSVSLYAVQWLTQGPLSWPPREAMHSLAGSVIWGLLAGVIGATVGFMKPSFRGVRYVMLGIVAVAIVAAVVVKLPKPYAWVGQALLIGLGSWACLRSLAFTRWPAVSFLPVGVWAAGIGGLLLATGNLKLAQLAGAAAFSLLGLFAAAVLRQRKAGPGGETIGVSLADPVLAVVCAYVGSLLVLGVTIGSTPRNLATFMGLAVPITALLITQFVLTYAKPRVVALAGVGGGKAYVPRHWLAGIAGAAAVALLSGIAIALGAVKSSDAGYP